MVIINRLYKNSVFDILLYHQEAFYSDAIMCHRSIKKVRKQRNEK